MIIPYQELEAETLNNLITEFVSRDGTDNGYESNIERRIEQVLRQLKAKEAVIVFDHESESVNIISLTEARAMGL